MITRQPVTMLTVVVLAVLVFSSTPTAGESISPQRWPISTASPGEPSGAPILSDRQSPATRLLFVANAGQWPTAARFQAWGGPRTVWLAEDAIWITVVEQTPLLGREGSDATPTPPSLRERRIEGGGVGVSLKFTFPNAAPHPHLAAVDPLPTSVSYFIGANPDQWRSAVPVYGGVRYVDLYPGVDLVLGGADNFWRLEAAPGAPTAQIKVKIEGAAVQAVTDDVVHLAAAGEDFFLALPQAPFTYQLAGVVRQAEPLTLEVAPHPSASQAAWSNDDPSDLVYSTFLGGSSDDLGYSLAVDAAGNAYTTGQTISGDFPTTPGVFDPSHNGDWDVFVAKLNPAGSNLVYATFLGGSSSDYGYHIAVDRAGSVYVTGQTYSGDFPATPGAFDTSYNGGWDTFGAKVNATGSGLDYATFLGGSSDDLGSGIGVDGPGSAYVIGWTASNDFPATPGAFDTSYNGGDWDAFIAKLSPTGSGLAYATFLGGSGIDYGGSIPVDEAGNAYVTGMTHSDDFPTTPGAFDTSQNGGDDAFVAKMNPAGSGLVFATFLGGASNDSGTEVRVDGAHNAYVAGYTYSADFPTTPGAFDTSYNGDRDTFVIELNPAGSALTYATFFGGSAYDAGWSLAVDGAGNAYVAGETVSDDLPTTPGAFDPSYNWWDAFVFKLNPAGSELLYSSYLGGTGRDRGWSIATDGKSSAYVTGLTDSYDFPTTPGSYDPGFNGGYYGDLFVTKLDASAAPTAVKLASFEAVVNPSTPAGAWLVVAVLGLAGVVSAVPVWRQRKQCTGSYFLTNPKVLNLAIERRMHR